MCLVRQQHKPLQESLKLLQKYAQKGNTLSGKYCISRWRPWRRGRAPGGFIVTRGGTAVLKKRFAEGGEEYKLEGTARHQSIDSTV